MTPARRLAAGCFVLILHVLIVWGFIIQPPLTKPLQPEVHVTLAPPSVRPPPMLLPPPLLHAPARDLRTAGSYNPEAAAQRHSTPGG